MIDIDHETGSAYTENLNIPGEEAVLHEPNMDQIDHKLSAPNMTGKVFGRNLSKFSSFSFEQFIWTSIKSNSKGKNRSQFTFRPSFEKFELLTLKRKPKSTRLCQRI